ncbi:MAG: sulfatase-like hydrolase/transferase [Armatimonadetes bacterium]|nr:sulfatase-like hydrolase/transferase [Armatimonadota bacterium]
MPTRPNFIVILTDDQGWGDLGCQGSADLLTPHLDALADSGVRLPGWYSNSPVCSPSRAALLTGRYPGNAGVRAILAGHRQATGLTADAPTLATALGRLGYGCSLSGKWHLGVTEPCRPHHAGFDDWFGLLAGCVDYYSHIFYWGMGPGQDPVHDLWDNNEEVWLNGEYATDLITDRAIDQIEHAAAAAQPFFAYVAYNAPHYPMHAPEPYLKRFSHLPPERRVMAAMLAVVDDGVGRIVATLERLGLREDTCIVFVSDNGPSRETRNWLDGTRDPYHGGTAGGFRGHKFSLFEGGIRVPALMSWPARLPAGRVLDGPLASMDVFPTVLAAAGGEAAGYELDGTNQLPYLCGALPQPAARPIFWEMDRQTAVREGPWKLVLDGQLEEGLRAEDAVHLAHVEQDPGEQHNLAADCPEVAARLSAAAGAWRAGIEQRWQEQWLPNVRHTTALGESKA